MTTCFTAVSFHFAIHYNSYACNYLVSARGTTLRVYSMSSESASTTTDHDQDLIDRFLGAFRNHPGGVAVVTADAGDGPVALTATSVSSFSAEPPMVMFSASSRSSSTPTIKRADSVVVHLLDENDLALAQLGATSGVDRFADKESWDRLPSGEVRFHRAASWLRCRVVRQTEVHGSLVVLAEVHDAGGRNTDPNHTPGRPLVYHSRAWHALGDSTKLEG